MKRKNQNKKAFDHGCVWVRLARKSVADALRTLRRMSWASQQYNAMRLEAEPFVKANIRDGHFRRDGAEVVAVTKIGVERMAELKEHFAQTAHEGGFAFADSKIYYWQKRLAARAFCCNALRDLEHPEAKNHPRGIRAEKRALLILDLLTETEDF